MLEAVCGKEGGRCELEMLSIILICSRTRADVLADDLERAGFVRVGRNGFNPASVVLTEPGKRYAVENALVR